MVDVKLNLTLKTDPLRLLGLQDRHITFPPGKMKQYWYFGVSHIIAITVPVL